MHNFRVSITFMCRMAFNLREEAARERALTEMPEETLRWEVYYPSNMSRPEHDDSQLDSEVI